MMFLLLFIFTSAFIAMLAIADDMAKKRDKDAREMYSSIYSSDIRRQSYDVNR